MDVLGFSRMKQKTLIWIFVFLLSCSLASALIKDGMVLYYSKDNDNISGSDPLDLMNSYDGTTHGATTGIKGYRNEGFSYDGISDDVDTSYSIADINLDHTISAWINVSEPDGCEVVIAAQGFTLGMFIGDCGFAGTVNKVQFCNYDGEYDCATSTTTILKATWYWVTGVYNANSHVEIWVNGVNEHNATTTNLNAVPKEFGIGNDPDGDPYWFKGFIDEVMIHNRTLTGTEIKNTYDNYLLNITPFEGGGGVAGDSTPPGITIITPTNASTNNTPSVFAWINVSANENVSIYVNDTRWVLNWNNVTDYYFYNTNYASLTDGAYTINITANDTSQNNNSVLLYFYIDQTSPNITSNIENNNTHWGLNLNLSVNVSDGTGLGYLMINDSCGFGYYNNSIPSSYNFYRNINIINCSLGQQHTNITVKDLAGNTRDVTYLWTSMGILNITATSAITANSINNFTIYKDGIVSGSTTTGFYILNNLTAGGYNITIVAVGYELKSAIVNVVNKTNDYSFSLYTSNSLNIIIRDELTDSPINQNITIKFTSIIGEFTNITNTSSLYIDNLNTTEYTILLSSTGYSPRTYTVTIGNKTFQNLWAYLAQNTSTTLFTVTDQDTGGSLEDVLFSMYRYLNGSWAAVESKHTDITGQAQFTYIPVEHYKFYLSKTGYENYVFYLNPILFSTYDVKMTKSTIINYSQDFDGLSIIYAPHKFPNNNVTTFNFIISSPSGLLIQYGIDLTFPGGTASATGVNAIGEQLSVLVNISNASTFDTVQLKYYYITTSAGRRNFTALLPIDFVAGESSLTFMARKDRTYGLGVFERILIMTIVVIFVVGIGCMVGQAVPGLALGLFVWGYTVYIGFTPIWAVLPSMFIGFMFLMWKSGGF